MAVKIRLTRIGKKKAPCYRIVAMDSKKARDGQYIEQIGFYNPVSNPVEIKIDADLAKKWLGLGAQPTDTVRGLFVNAGIVEKKVFKEVKKPEPVVEEKAVAVEEVATEEAPAEEAKKDEE